MHNAYLDITHRDGEWTKRRFPKIAAYLSERGLDVSADRLPVIPAAHYTCGGVETDLNGRTTLRGLYAAGEAARTGVHGGNRLASTSLLEGLVYGAAVADHVGVDDEGKETSDLARGALDLHVARSSGRRSGPEDPLGDTMEWYSRKVVNGEALRRISAASALLQRLKGIMWDDVGLIRTPSGLSRAVSKVAEMGREADHLFVQVPCAETAGLRDACRAGEEVARAALANRVSRGAHTIILDGVGEGIEETAAREEDEEEEQLMGAAAGV